MNKTLILACALALAGASNVALASDESATFLRVEAGHTDIDSDLVGEDTDSNATLRGGYYYTPNFAVEAFVGTLYDGEILGFSAKLEGYGIGGIAKKNFGANDTGLFINGRAGVLRAKAEIGGFRDDETEPYVGVGAGYDFSKAFGLSVNYDVVRTEFDGLDVDVEMLSAGAEYRF